jgi:outer membrane protein assembly factor BamD (BamD/ComL family)
LLDAASSLNKGKFDEAEKKLQAIKEEVGKQEDLFRFVILHWISKVSYKKGDYPKAFQLTEDLIKELESTY